MGIFGLTSPGLLALAIVTAAALPVCVGWLAAGRGGEDRGSRIRTAAAAIAVCLLAQFAGVFVVFLAINQSYQFYSSFGDLLGETVPATDIHTDLPGDQAGGRVRLITVDGHASRTTAQVLVWTPPQYDEPAYRHHRFPVMEFLPGQPGQPGSAFEAFHLASDADRLIASHQIAPFVIVVPPLMIRPPTDTECTDVPDGGPRALTWLSHDVVAGVRQQLRVQAPGPHWSVMGWSTGGFCAAKLVLQSHPAFSAAVSFGAYFQPITDGAYPHLLGVTPAQIRQNRRANSPQDLLVHFGLRGRHLLAVSGRQDGESWPSTARFLQVARYERGLSYIAFAKGGHNLHDYPSYTARAMLWLRDVKALP